MHIYTNFAFIVLLLILCLRFVIFETYISTHKQRFRIEALQRNEKAVKTLAVPLHELYKDFGGIEWKDQNRELVVNGKYHEVLHVEKRGQDALVFIIEDTEEDLLFAEFFSENDDQKNNFNLLTAFLFGLNFTSQFPDLAFDHPSDTRMHSLTQEFHVAQGHYAVWERPPTPLRFRKG